MILRSTLPAALLASLLLLAPVADAAPAATRYEELADTVQSLLDAHDRITKETGELYADELKRRGEAEALLGDGLRQLAAGKVAEARTALQQAYQLATELIIRDRSGQTLATRRSDQYVTSPLKDRNEALVQARIESVQALTDAYRRVAEEKQLSQPPQMEAIQRTIEEARAALFIGRSQEALGLVNAAYEQASAVVVGARQGDTLTKTLAFESPAEEYRYELDRFASYKMLLQLAMADDTLPVGMRQIAARAEIDAALLEDGAETEARKNRHAEAVKLLESASAVIMKAIRASGRFLPG